MLTLLQTRQFSFIYALRICMHELVCNDQLAHLYTVTRSIEAITYLATQSHSGSIYENGQLVQANSNSALNPSSFYN